MSQANAIRRLESFIGALSEVPGAGGTFEVIAALGDGTAIPAEALNEDHTIGLYSPVIPRKMRENLAGFREIEVADLRPGASLSEGATGGTAEWFLEYPGLREVRFRAERLQYLEEGWWAVTREVVYPARAVLALAFAMKQQYGAVHLCLNVELPMPLWLRPASLGEETSQVQAVIQARGEGRVLFTNIHSECTLAYAAQWAEAARSYYRTDD